MTDITITDHGSMCIVTGVSPEGRDWLEANLECPRWVNGFVVEPRYLPSIVKCMLADGLVVDG